MFDLHGKVAVVTGSTSGIGRGIAESLAKSGANIVLNGRHETPETEKQRAELETKYGIKAIYICADMTKPDDITRMIGTTARTFGKVDILVNNAGIQHVAPIDEFPIEKWNEIIAVHQTAPFLAMRAAIPYMKQEGWGRIINIASAHGTVASPGKAAYVTAKHGMLGLTKTVALEVADKGITCNSISPGYVWTPLVEKQIQSQARTLGISVADVQDEVFMSRHATRKFTTVEQIGEMAVFLCSDAAQNMTGSDFKVDGGWTAGQVPLKRPDPKNAPKPATLEHA